MGVGKSNRPTWCPSFLVSSLFPILLRFDSFRDNSCVPPTPPPIPIIVPWCRDPCSSWTFVLDPSARPRNESWNVVRTIVPLFVMVMRYDDEFGKASLFFFFSSLPFSSLLFSFFGRAPLLGFSLLTCSKVSRKRERRWVVVNHETRRRRRRCAMDE